MDNRLNHDALVEDALKSMPLAPMPRSITSNVLAQIQKDTRPTLLTWNDLVLGFVFALSAWALVFTLQHLPPVAVAKLRIQGILLYHDLLHNARWLIPALMFGLASILAAFTIPMLLQMMSDRRK